MVGKPQKSRACLPHLRFHSAEVEVSSLSKIYRRQSKAIHICQWFHIFRQRHSASLDPRMVLFHPHSLLTEKEYFSLDGMRNVVRSDISATMKIDNQEY